MEFEQYHQLTYQQEGGWGHVHKAQRIDTNKLCAMKFFGYTSNRPDVKFIQQEIDLMWSLRDVAGTLKLHGVFEDSEDGHLVPQYHKYFCRSYPVIVMDIGGLDLLTRISMQSHVSEDSLAKQFRSMMIGLRNIHNERKIHRDLKPDNVLVSPDDTDADKIYIIDFGHMKELSSRADQIVETNRRPIGTPGYFAPESISYNVYSAKSDVWQAGCILYIMLNGGLVAPFVSKPEDVSRHQITMQTYYPLEAKYGFGATSALAKDLVSRMLQRDPNVRISVEEILQHPWLNGQASTEELPPEHKRCMRNTAHRRKLKTFFLTRNILTSNVIPNILRQESMDNLGSNADSSGDLPPVNATSISVIQSAFYGRLKALKSHCQDLFSDGVDCDRFIEIMNQNDLSEIANEEVFRYFDINRDGVIGLHEFVLALISLDIDDEINAAKVYFNFFDMDDDDILSHDEFITLIRYVLGDEYSIGIAEHYHGLAASLSQKKGLIDFETFKQFYENVMITTTSRSVGYSTAHSIR